MIRIKTVEQIINNINDLPSLPDIILQVTRIIEDPNSTAQDLGDIINKDQSLTARVLRMANSAHYGFPRRIATVTDAVILLGFQTVKSIAMAASVCDMLNREMKGYALNSGDLWKHSQSVAIISKFLAKRVKYPLPHLAYTVGLLHDIGKVILNQYLMEQYQEVVQEANDNKMPFIDAETKVFGYNHADVGAKMAEKWNLPPQIYEAIQNHHTPLEKTVDPTLTNIVYLADAVAMTMGIGLGVDGLCYSSHPDVLNQLKIKSEDIEETIINISEILIDENNF